MRAAVVDPTLMVLLLALGGSASGSIGPSASLEVSADPVQPADAPVLLVLTIRNTGKTSISYWWGGPADYPDASSFVAVLTHEGNLHAVWTVALANGQDSSGAGRARELNPGESVMFPAALPPLPVGSYRIRVQGAPQNNSGDAALVTWPATRSDPELKLEVRVDVALAAARDDGLIAHVRGGDSFAQHVAAVWPRALVRDALLRDLMSDNVFGAERALDGLWPGDADKKDASLVARALTRHVKAPDGRYDFALVDRLLQIAGRFDSAEVRDAAAQVLAARPRGRVHEAAVKALDAIRVAHGRAPAPVSPTPLPRDPATVDALLKIIGSADPHERELAYLAMGDYLDDPRAMTAVRAGIHDPDAKVQAAARAALGRAPKTIK